MYNIYSFLYYALSMSVMALFLLMIKQIFLDKLSPRWQYGVWSILAIRVLLPLNGKGREVTGPVIQMSIETLKQLIEPNMTSAFTDLHRITRTSIPIPWFSEVPVSITDWLFVFYAAGFWITLIWYAVSYLRLRRLLHAALPCDEALNERLQGICMAHKLKSCEVRQMEGLTSAFVCGVFKPVLVLPTNNIPDDQILLHELLHLKYYDGAQNLFWCFVKALNWCNPLIRWICNVIGNDLESLCDQRVLERLEGEELRNYGHTLLRMANERYARAPGTTSLSNGGRCIARRIEAIARFKRYPQGMSVVSVCLCLIIAVTFLMGNTADPTLYKRPFDRPVRSAMSLASVRLYRCSTAAGAVDTYAKGLINEDRMAIAAASPMQDQSEIIFNQKTPWMQANDWQYNAGNNYTGYTLYNLQQVSDVYEALLVYEVGPRSEDPAMVENMWADYYAVYPIRLQKQDDRWTVIPAAEPYRQQVLGNDKFMLPVVQTYEAQGQYGAVTLHIQTTTEVDNRRQMEGAFWSGMSYSFDHELKPDAAFKDTGYMIRYSFEYAGPREEVAMVGIGVKEYEYDSLTPRLSDFPKSLVTSFNTHGKPVGYNFSGSSSELGFAINQEMDENWNGLLQGGGGGGWSGGPNVTEVADLPDLSQQGYAVCVYLNDRAQEVMIMEEVSK